MSEDKKTSNDYGDGRKPIPVDTLKFSEPIDLPKKPGASGLKTEVQDNKPSYSIEYLPWMRHHRVTYREALERVDQPGGVQEMFIHESKVKVWTAAAKAK